MPTRPPSRMLGIAKLFWIALQSCRIAHLSRKVAGVAAPKQTDVWLGRKERALPKHVRLLVVLEPGAVPGFLLLNCRHSGEKPVGEISVRSAIGGSVRISAAEQTSVCDRPVRRQGCSSGPGRPSRGCRLRLHSLSSEVQSRGVECRGFFRQNPVRSAKVRSAASRAC